MAGRAFLLDTSVVLALMTGKELGTRIDATYGLYCQLSRKTMTFWLVPLELYSLCSQSTGPRSRTSMLTRDVELLPSVGHDAPVQAVNALPTSCSV